MKFKIGSYQNSHFWQNDKKHKLLETMRFERKFQKIQKIHVNPKYKMSLASFWHHTLLLNYCLYSTRLTRWNFFSEILKKISKFSFFIILLKFSLWPSVNVNTKYLKHHSGVQTVALLINYESCSMSHVLKMN